MTGDWLLGGDYFFLKLLNRDLGSAATDIFWYSLTELHKNPFFLGLLGVLAIGYGFYKFGLHTFKPVLVAAAVIGLADAVTYRLIKYSVERPRPIHNPEISEWLRPVGDAHGFSFPSNHATNMFAMAFVLSRYFPKGRYFFYTFALLVALSRVGLGVHYPSDVLGGALIGTAIAALALWPLRKYEPLWNMNSSKIRG
jgi:undecaprenyl-diphosphatase